MLLLVWEHIGDYSPARAALTTWLAVLARNCALNRRRAGQRRCGDVALEGDLPDSAATPEQALLQKERVEAAARAVARLSPRDRALFYRKYYYCQSTAQIAAELGLSERAVEGRLYRIRRRLQGQLGGDGHD